MSKTLSDLHAFIFLGVPFSTKEGIKVKGMHNSYGSPIRRHVRAKNDAEAVRLLKKVIIVLKCQIFYNLLN